MAMKYEIGLFDLEYNFSVSSLLIVYFSSFLAIGSKQHRMRTTLRVSKIWNNDLLRFKFIAARHFLRSGTSDTDFFNFIVWQIEKGLVGICKFILMVNYVCAIFYLEMAQNRNLICWKGDKSWLCWKSDRKDTSQLPTSRTYGVEEAVSCLSNDKVDTKKMTNYVIENIRQKSSDEVQGTLGFVDT